MDRHLQRHHHESTRPATRAIYSSTHPLSNAPMVVCRRRLYTHRCHVSTTSRNRASVEIDSRVGVSEFSHPNQTHFFGVLPSCEEDTRCVRSSTRTGSGFRCWSPIPFPMHRSLPTRPRWPIHRRVSPNRPSYTPQGSTDLGHPSGSHVDQRGRSVTHVGRKSPCQ